jgi:cytochrome c-type biogenesis protein CcmH/NrfF
VAWQRPDPTRAAAPTRGLVATRSRLVPPARGTALRWRATALVGLLLALTSTRVAVADEPSAQHARRAHVIASNIMSPFCPGSTIASCSSPRAAEWRADIQAWVTEGVSEQEIRRRLAARVPGHDLSGTAAPSVGWGLPIGLAVCGVVLLAVLLRRFAQARPVPEPSSAEPKDRKWDEQLQRELDRLDE